MIIHNMVGCIKYNRNKERKIMLGISFEKMVEGDDHRFPSRFFTYDHVIYSCINKCHGDYINDERIVLINYESNEILRVVHHHNSLVQMDDIPTVECCEDLLKQHLVNIL